jgi:adenine deaminase
VIYIYNTNILDLYSDAFSDTGDFVSAKVGRARTATTERAAVMETHRIAAELVLRNGWIYTMDAADPWATCLAIRDGKFVAIGSAAAVAPLIGAGTEVVDAEGRMVLPGLLDSHAHAVEGAWADLYEVRFSATE